MGHFRVGLWISLVQVAILWALALLPGGGSPPPLATVLDVLVKHHTYDGLGRLVRTQSPYPSPELADGGVRTERFYHDGVRRLQEVVSDPVISMAMAMGSGDPDLLALATAAGGAAVTAGEVDGSATPQARGTKFRAGDWTA